jgi:hypothetical protein
MTLEKVEVTCPRCGHRFEIDDSLVHRMEARIRDELQGVFDKEINDKEKEALEKARVSVGLVLMEKDKKLEEQRKQIGIMKQKIEQGSTQLQGEVQEIAIETELSHLFKFDEIQEVPKGVRGADAIQIVRSEHGIECGKILFESKRTKGFSPSWVEKLKSDQLRERADIAVLVTQQLPPGVDNIGAKDGVWVCGFQEFKGLALVLRDSLLKVHIVRESQQKKSDKKNMLYDYLTSNEFRLELEAILEGFAVLKDSTSKERLVMEKMWKEREKQLEKVLINTTSFYGSMKGILANSIPNVVFLELPDKG